MAKKKTMGDPGVVPVQQPAQAPPTIVVNSGGGSGKLIAGVLLLGAAVGGAMWYNKKKKDDAAAAEGEKVGTEADASAASEITQAKNPSGISWLQAVDGTNAVQIMAAMTKAIKAGKTYKEISDSYKKLTKGNKLEDDMKAELSAEQYQTFLAVTKLNQKGDYANNNNFKQPVKGGETISAAAKLIVRKTPYINGTPRLIDIRGNAIEFVENPGTYIGIATGVYKTTTSRATYLADSASIATVFYEVIVHDATYKSYKVWVAAGLIKVSPKGTKPSSFNKIYVMKKSEYDKANAVNKPALEGLGCICKLL